MHIDSYFSLSNSSIEEADYVVFGIPYDSTQTFRSGSRFAPNAIREASWNLESYSAYFLIDLESVRICDAGNVNCDGSFDDIVIRTQKLINSFEAFPIAIGGEHTISYAVFKNFKDSCYVVFDAHLDLRDEFDGNRFSHACVSRRVYELGSNLIVIGVRSFSREELDFAEENCIEFYYSWDLIERGVNPVIEKVSEYENVYISLDMDVFDPAYAPGVSTPEPLGIHPLHFLKIISAISKRIVGFDVVEVIPDQNKITQTLAAKLIFELIAAKQI